MTYLGGEFVQWVGLNGVNSEGVVAVDGSETGGNFIVSVEVLIFHADDNGGGFKTGCTTAGSTMSGGPTSDSAIAQCAQKHPAASKVS